MKTLRLALLATTAMSIVPIATTLVHAQTAPMIVAQQQAPEGEKKPGPGEPPKAPPKAAPPAAHPAPPPPPPPAAHPPAPPAAAPHPAPPPPAAAPHP
ncbi:OmpA family protein, partial [Bradyrhizobium sp. U87765 SZCCT0109]|nr:OmpA family protein [Bradyrhizobium sp. U87765 SZCCT0109]